VPVRAGLVPAGVVVGLLIAVVVAALAALALRRAGNR